VLIHRRRNRVSRSFPRRSRRGAAATLAGSSALPAIVMRHGMSGNCDLFKGQLGGHQIEIFTALTRLVSPSNIHGNWKANQYSICGQLCRQNGLFRVAEKLLPTWVNWTRQLHSNVEVNHTLLAGEIGPRWYTAYNDYLATPCRSLSRRIRPRNQKRRHHLPAFQARR
jgi:hypothetical protein